MIEILFGSVAVGLGMVWILMVLFTIILVTRL